MRKMFLKWPSIALACLVTASFCLPSTEGALLNSQPGPVAATGCGLSELEKGLLGSYLVTGGWSRAEIGERLSYFSRAELRQLVLSREGVMVGAGEQDRKAAGVALVLLVTLGLITGFYLFANQ